MLQRAEQVILQYHHRTRFAGVVLAARYRPDLAAPHSIFRDDVDECLILGLE